jgi:predicted Zn finger-like uncharacterized protein
MFTVCPKCSLTLVVTAQDLRVAQGYVRCGRCSNVFNAIVGLTDDRGNSASAGQSTASTTIMRKAPAISDDEPDPLSATGETEMIYAEPAPASPPARKASPPPATAKSSSPQSPPESQKRYSDTEGVEEKRYSDTEGVEEKRYSDTEGIETYPEHELEFNPNLTDVTKVFVEAAPVTIKPNAATGQFEKIVLKPEDAVEAFAPPPAPRVPTARSSQSAAPPSRIGTTAPAATPAPAANPSAASKPKRAATPPPTPTSTASPTKTASSAKPASSPKKPAQKPAASAPPARDPRDDRDAREEEDTEIDTQLRSLADRLDVTASRRAAGLPTPAANAEALESARDFDEIDADEEEDRSTGDIYTPATPRPPPPRSSARTATRGTRAGNSAAVADDDEMQAVGAADALASAPPKRNRFMLWVAGAAVLSLALVAQAIHHNRHDLATNAVLNRPLTNFYKAIGVTLVPNWDLTAYDVRQLGASTNERGPGTLTVRASLKNNASQALPLPLLRITMQDRYGNRIATRDVLPVGYVPGTVPADAQLGTGQRLDAEMTFKDPGQDAVGFEIDACLPSANGRIACANDTASPAR